MFIPWPDHDRGTMIPAFQGHPGVTRKAFEQDFGTGPIYSFQGIHTQVLMGVAMIEDDGEPLSGPNFMQLLEQADDAGNGRSIGRGLDTFTTSRLVQCEIVGETYTISAAQRSYLVLAIRIEGSVTQLVAGGAAGKRDLVLPTVMGQNQFTACMDRG